MECNCILIFFQDDESRSLNSASSRAMSTKLLRLSFDVILMFLFFCLYFITF